MDKIKLRKAVAMIELIFAIVIMGIVLMSAPMMMSQATQSSLVLVQQEAIAGGASEIGLILTRHWDEADTNESLNAPILNTDSNLTQLQEVNGTGRRAGTPLTSDRTFITSSGNELNASTVLGLEEALLEDADDVDDYNGQTTTVAAGGKDDYKDALTLKTNVVYIKNDFWSSPNTTLKFNNPFTSSTLASGGKTTNIKKITINITSAQLDTNIQLNAFSCNIGTYRLNKRTFY